MSELNQNVSLDDLLDGTLDDLADVPEFKPFPAGAHNCKLNFKTTTINEMPAIEVKLTGVETMELVNPEDKPIAPGDSTNVVFILKKKDKDTGKVVRNELAEGQFKEVMKSLAPAFPEASTTRAIMEAAEGYECLVVTGIRENKKDKNDIKRYTSIEKLAVA